jgi:hypothetical protein
MKRLAVAALLLAGCDISLEPTPAPPRCMPSTRYFVSPFWLGYIDANQCASSGCHAFSDGHGYLRFRPPGTAPSPTATLDTWPDAWRANYDAAIALVNCEMPLASRLLTVPEGKADPHPPGVAVMNDPVAEQMFTDWLNAR